MHIVALREVRLKPLADQPITFVFRAGRSYTVKRAWGEQMVGMGAALETGAPSRPERPLNA